MVENKRVEFLCPNELLVEFEKAIEGKYATVSEAVRDFMRRTIEEAKKP